MVKDVSTSLDLTEGSTEGHIPHADSEFPILCCISSAVEDPLTFFGMRD
jgi:hypothetical protein